MVLLELSLCENYSNPKEGPTYEGQYGKVVKNRHGVQASQALPLKLAVRWASF